MSIGTLIPRYIAPALAIGVLSGASFAGAPQKNTTGLPTYPNDHDGTMDAVVRLLPNGQHCSQYSGHTPDDLAKVVDWYKGALPGTKSTDINKESLYGTLKLDGVKFLIGNNIVNVYRMPKSNDGGVLFQRADTHSTYIEIFKCNDAPKR